MEFVRVFLAGCTALAATSLGAAGVLAIKRIPPALYATVVSCCAGVMGFSALVMQAASSQNLRRLRVNELICKPYNPLNIDEVREKYYGDAKKA